ncbi:MAG: hypothetical protein P8X94_09770 [Woeseiaceae bacterium]
MTQRFALFAVLILAMGTAGADGLRHKGPDGPDIDSLAILLDLDDYQKQEVERIMTEHRAAAEARREAFRASGERPDPETIKAQREAMRANLQTELATVLSPEQLEKLDTLREMRRDRHPRKHRRHDVMTDDSEAG